MYLKMFDNKNNVIANRMLCFIQEFSLEMGGGGGGTLLLLFSGWGVSWPTEIVTYEQFWD